MSSVYKKLFISYLETEGIKYTDIDEFVVKVVYSGDHIKAIPVYVFFDKDNDPIIQLKCWNIENFMGEEAKGILACNEMNSHYRWIKFYLDKDSDIVADCDAYIDAETCGKECLNLVRRMVNITDEAYPTFEEYKWSRV